MTPKGENSRKKKKYKYKKLKIGYINNKSPVQENRTGLIAIKKRRCPTLPHSRPCSTIGAKELNFRVRNGNGWILFAMTAVKSVLGGGGVSPALMNIVALIPKKHGDYFQYPLEGYKLL